MNHKLLLLPRAIAPLLLLLLLSACSFSLAEDIIPPPGAEVPATMPTQPPPSGPLYPLLPPDPAQGAPIYAEKCAPCHGPNGLGDGPQASQLPNPPSPLGSLDLARQSKPVEWYTMVSQGNLERFMPPFSSLSERQRWDVIAFVYTLSSPPGLIAQGGELFTDNCASCHGPQGHGDGPDAANLQAELPDLSDQKRMAEKSPADLFQAISAGVAPAMPAFEGKLGEDERWALAAYLRSLTFATAEKAAAPGDTVLPQESITAETPSGTPIAATPQPIVTSSGLGSVQGMVVNNSGDPVPAVLTVTLHGFDDMQQNFTVTTTTQTDGSFTFQEVEMPPGRAFLASVLYSNATYTSDIALVEAGSNSLDLTIPIFETTTDASGLSVDRLHLFFEYVEPDTLRVVELFIISNLTDRTVVAPEEGAAVITFSLPEGATNLQFEDGALGGRYVETSNGFGDTAAIRPGAGQHQVVFSYDLPYKRKVTFIQPLNLPVEAVVILIPEDGLKVKSDQLQDAGVRPVQGISYRMFTTDRMEKGSNLSITVSGRPRSTGAGLDSDSSTSLVIGLSAFGLALIAAGVWLYRRNRAARMEEINGEDAAEIPAVDMHDEETLMEAILALDDQYQAGELPEEAYRARRAELKARLMDVLKT